MRTSTFILGDDRGVTPSNVDQGYILRRLIRRAVRHGMKLGMSEGFTCEIAKVIIDQYKDELSRAGAQSAASSWSSSALEEERFQRTLKKGRSGIREGLHEHGAQARGVRSAEDRSQRGSRSPQRSSSCRRRRKICR